MAKYFRKLASHAALDYPAIIDIVESSTSPPEAYTYAELLSRVTVFREHVVAASKHAGLQLEGVRIGIMVPPGVNFVAAVLSTWSLKAIVGKAISSALRFDKADMNESSSNMS